MLSSFAAWPDDAIACFLVNLCNSYQLTLILLFLIRHGNRGSYGQRSAIKKGSKKARRKSWESRKGKLHSIQCLEKLHNFRVTFQKAEYKSGEQTSNENVEDSGEDVSQGKYGHTGLIQSAEKRLDRNFVDVRELKGSIGKTPVWVRARVHTSRCKGKQCFLVLRQQSSTVQVLISVNDVVSKQMVKFSGS